MDQTISQTALRQWGLWVLTALIVWLLDSLGFMGWGRYLGEPVVRVVSSAGGQVVKMGEIPFKTVSYWIDGSERISSLEHRLSVAVVERQRLAFLEEENTLLRQKTGVSSNTQLVMTAVPVLAKSESLLIGSNELAVGATVTDREGILVGRISRIGRFLSIVERPFDSGSQIAVKVQDKPTIGIVKGDGKAAVLEEVLQGDNLAVGDVLVTSGVDDKFPAGLVVGQVVELTGRPADVTKGGKVELLAKVEKFVLVRQ